MRAVIQRVRRAAVTVEDRQVAGIGRGLVVLVGVAETDTEPVMDFLVTKLHGLRIFEDEAGKMNRSVVEIDGGVIVVPNFTLCAETRSGRRPSFSSAAPPERARALCEFLVARLNALGVPTQSGEFGAMMRVDLENDGPVTLVLERNAE